jgi:hypothetical protein
MAATAGQVEAVVQHQRLLLGQRQPLQRRDHLAVLGVQRRGPLRARGQPGQRPPVPSGAAQPVHGQPERGLAHPRLRVLVAGELPPAAGRADERLLGDVLGGGQVPGQQPELADHARVGDPEERREPIVPHARPCRRTSRSITHGTAPAVPSGG